MEKYNYINLYYEILLIKLSMNIPQNINLLDDMLKIKQELLIIEEELYDNKNIDEILHNILVNINNVYKQYKKRKLL